MFFFSCNTKTAFLFTTSSYFFNCKYNIKNHKNNQKKKWFDNLNRINVYFTNKRDCLLQFFENKLHYMSSKESWSFLLRETNFIWRDEKLYGLEKISSFYHRRENIIPFSGCDARIHLKIRPKTADTRGVRKIRLTHSGHDERVIDEKTKLREPTVIQPMLIDLFLPAGSHLLFHCRRPRVWCTLRRRRKRSFANATRAVVVVDDDDDDDAPICNACTHPCIDSKFQPARRRHFRVVKFRLFEK